MTEPGSILDPNTRLATPNFPLVPEELRGRYQYFTEAGMEKLRAAGCPINFHSLEDGVADYVQSHLSQENQYR